MQGEACMRLAYVCVCVCGGGGGPHDLPHTITAPFHTPARSHAVFSSKPAFLRPREFAMRSLDHCTSRASTRLPNTRALRQDCSGVLWHGHCGARGHGAQRRLHDSAQHGASCTSHFSLRRQYPPEHTQLCAGNMSYGILTALHTQSHVAHTVLSTHAGPEIPDQGRGSVRH